VFWGFNRGFDVTDEGWYLLLYNHPQDVNEFWSGFHLIPRLFGLHPPLTPAGLRILKFTLHCIASVAFYFSFSFWLDNHKPLLEGEARRSMWPLNLLLFGPFTAFAIICQTPGYDDFSAIFGICASTALMHCLYKPSTKPLNVWYPLITGVFVSLQGFVKWTSGLSMFTLTFACLFVSRARRPLREQISIAISFLGGIAVGFCLLNIFVTDLYKFAIGVKASIVVANKMEHRSLQMLENYGRGVFNATWVPIKYSWWGLLSTVIWVFLQKLTNPSPIVSRAAIIFPVISVANLVYFFIHKELYLKINHGYLHFFHIAIIYHNLIIYFLKRKNPTAVAETLTEKQTDTIHSPERINYLSGTLLLLLTPLCVAAGTNTSLIQKGHFAMTTWIAIHLIAFEINRKEISFRIFSNTLLLLVALSLEIEFLVGHSIAPYRLAGALYNQNQRSSPDVGQTGALYLNEQLCRLLNGLHWRLTEAGFQRGDVIVSLFDLPGIVYLSGGSSPQIAWYWSDNDGQIISRLPTIFKRMDYDRTNGGAGFKHAPFLLMSEPIMQAHLKILSDRLDFPGQYSLLETFSLDQCDGRSFSLWKPTTN
jgi:hypothetical protein